MSAVIQKTNETTPGFETVGAGKAPRPEVNFSGDDENVIDLVDLFYVLMDKIWYLIFAFFLGAVIVNAYTFFRIAPTYESTAKLYIVSASEDSVVNLSDLNIGTNLTSDYVELMGSYPVLDQVIERLELPMDAKVLAKLVSVTNPSNTRILCIKAVTTDRQLSSDIANTLAEVAIDYLPKTMSTEEPNIAQEARVSIQKVGPSYARAAIIGALTGLFICCAIIIARYLMDDTIHNAEDLERYFGIVPLAEIPDIATDEHAGRKGRKKSKMNKRR